MLHAGPEPFCGFEPATLSLLQATNHVRHRSQKDKLAPTVCKQSEHSRLEMPPATIESINLITLVTWHEQLNTPIRVHSARARSRSPYWPISQIGYTTVCGQPFLNAFHFVNHGNAETLISLGPISDDQFGTLNTWMARFFPLYALGQCHFGTLHPDDWVMQQDKGVFLLVISGADEHGDTLEHVVALNAAALVIIDCCDSHTLMME